MLCGLACSAVVFRLGERHGVSLLPLLASLLAATLSGTWLFLLIVGMETPLFALLCAASLYTYAAESMSERAAWWATLLAALAFLARLEGMILMACLLGGDMLALLYRTRPRSDAARAMLIRWGVWTAVVGSFVAFKLWYYGSVIPLRVQMETVDSYYMQPNGILGYFLTSYPRYCLGGHSRASPCEVHGSATSSGALEA